MKFTLFIAIAAFSSISALGSPTPGTAEKSSTFEAAATQYWVCEAVSSSTRHYGWSQGGSESSALEAAKKQCGKSDCNSYECAELGCVGIDFGLNSVWLTGATGYGSPKNDGNTAASLALSDCEKYDSHCGKPSYFCSQRAV